MRGFEQMAIVKIVSSLVTIGLFGAALAQDQARIKVDFSSDDGSHEEIRLELDSDQLGIDLHDMQEGENRSVIDEQGRTILITREADGFVFEVEGRSIKMPLLHGEHGTIAMAHGGKVEDVDIQVLHHGDMTTNVDTGTMIVTGKPVDAATQDAIRSLLETAGHGDDVQFIDHESAGAGPHQVKVVRKVEVISD
jgi:hypothetical protein